MSLIIDIAGIIFLVLIAFILIARLLVHILAVGIDGKEEK